MIMSQDVTGTPKTKTTIVHRSLNPHKDNADLKEEKAKLEEQLKEKEDILKELRLNPKRKELLELDLLIRKWREVCQNSLTELHGKSCVACGRGEDDSDRSMAQFLDRLGVNATNLTYLCLEIKK